VWALASAYGWRRFLGGFGSRSLPGSIGGVVSAIKFGLKGSIVGGVGLFRGAEASHKVAIGGVVEELLFDFRVFLHLNCLFLSSVLLVLAFLRFEASLHFTLLDSELLELIDGLVEGALMSGLVAEVEGKGFGVGDFAGFGIEAAGKEPLGALRQPMAFRHVGDEDEFGRSRGLIFVGQGVLKGAELVLALEGKEGEVAVMPGQSVDGVILRGSGAA